MFYTPVTLVTPTETNVEQMSFDSLRCVLSVSSFGESGELRAEILDAHLNLIDTKIAYSKYIGGKRQTKVIAVALQH